MRVGGAIGWTGWRPAPNTRDRGTDVGGRREDRAPSISEKAAWA